MKFDTMLQKVPKISVYVLAFLLPLWFLPITQDILNFQKQALLIVVVLVGLLAWIAKTIRQGSVDFRQNWLGLGVVAVLLASAIATVASAWRYGSFWGWPLNVADSFLTLLFFVLFAVLVAYIIEDAKELPQFFFIPVLSVVIAGVYALLQLYQVFIFPFAATKGAIFNTVGSPSTIAVLAAVFLPLALTMAFTLKTWLKWAFGVSAMLLFITLMLVNFSTAWLILAITLAAMMLFAFRNLKKFQNRAWVSLSTALFIISLLLLFVRVSLPGSPALPLEVSPNLAAEMNIIKSVGMQSPIFGTGTGTFIFDYTKYHRTLLNQSVFWGTRFTAGPSALLDRFATEGILGGLAFLALMATSLWFAVRLLLQPKTDTAAWMVQLSIVSAFVGICAAQIFYYSNFTLAFMFWLLLGVIAFLTAKPKKTISIAPPQRLSIVFSALFLIVLIFGVGLIFFTGQKYVAEVKYLQGSRSFAKGDIQNATSHILSAANLNPSVDVYWRDLAQLYLAQLGQINVDNSLSDTQRTQQIQAMVARAVGSANQAIIVNPANVENWNVRGFVYRNLIGAPGADALAIESYTKASTLEPASPFSFTEMGRVYFLKKDFDNALKSLDKAIELKADYPPAVYLVALVYGAEGKLDEQIAKLEATKKLAPNDIGLAFQLGMIYYQKNDFSKAQGEFEGIKSLNENYASGRYMLGLTYDKRGQKTKAIAEFTKVLELNPDNAQIKQILSNLNAGKTALTGISEASLADNPPDTAVKPKAAQ